MVVAAALVAVGGALALFSVVRRQGQHPHPASSAPSEHAIGMDHAMGAILAAYRAPTGSTPCESAYNAWKASLDFSTQEHVPPIVLRLAPRDEFLQRCSALPGDTQACLVPVYTVRHRAECDKLTQPTDALAAMIELKLAGQPGTLEPEQGQDTP